MTRKIIISLLLLLVVVEQVPPLGTPAGTVIINGGDFGEVGITDSDGDVVLYYSTDISDLTYTTSNAVEVVVSSGFAIAPLPVINSPVYVTIGKSNYLLYATCNLANTSDTFVIEVSSLLPNGWQVYLVKDDDQNKLLSPNENTKFDTIQIPPDTTYYFFIVIDVSSEVTHGTSTEIKLTVKNQAGMGVDDGWCDEDLRMITFTAVAVLPRIKANIPVPTGLKVTKSTDSIYLYWDHAESQNILGYLVYKANSMENLCNLSITDFYVFTEKKSVIDILKSGEKAWYKVRSLDKDLNLSEDSMFISSEGEIVSVCYENKILAILRTSQDNKVLYKELNSLNCNIHIRLVKENVHNISTDILALEVECFKDGDLADKINKTFDLNATETKLEIYYNMNEVQNKTAVQDMECLNMFYYNQVEWVNIGGIHLEGKVVNKITYNGKYKLAVTSKIKQFELISISPKKFYSPLEQPPLDKLRFVLKHRKSIKPVGKIFDLTGAEIKTMSAEVIQEGTVYNITEFIWDGKDNNGKPVRSGIYIYQFESNDGIINGSIILVK